LQWEINAGGKITKLTASDGFCRQGLFAYGKKQKRGCRVISAAFGDYQIALCSKDAWALA